MNKENCALKLVNEIILKLLIPMVCFATPLLLAKLRLCSKLFRTTALVTCVLGEAPNSNLYPPPLKKNRSRGFLWFYFLGLGKRLGRHISFNLAMSASFHPLSYFCFRAIVLFQTVPYLKYRQRR